MKKIVFVTGIPLLMVASLLVMFIAPIEAPNNFFRAQISASDPLGPGTLPDWYDEAQVQLGWIFDDPTNPQDSLPLDGWDTAIGNLPSWSYDPDGTAFGYPAQWYIRIPNLINDNPMKEFWVSWVYKFEPLVQGVRTVTSIEWYPDEGSGNDEYSEEWFDIDGTPTTDYLQTAYARVTKSLDLYPNPEYEDLWLGVYGSNQYVMEVYVLTVCVEEEPEPEPIVFGPGTLPDWYDEAQVQLGWIFDDPTNPQDSTPLSGWDTAVGTIPSWSYDPEGIYNDQYAQWYIQIPNVDNDNPLKKIWISWIYDFNPDISDELQAFTNIDWEPNTGMDNPYLIEEWFDSNGDPTTDRLATVYARITGGIDIYPNPGYEDLWLGINGTDKFVREVYLSTICIEEEPEPEPEPTPETAIDIRLVIQYGEELSIDARVKLDNENVNMKVDINENSETKYTIDVNIDFTQNNGAKEIKIIINIINQDNPDIATKIKIIIQLDGNFTNINTDVNQSGNYIAIEISIDVKLG